MKSEMKFILESTAQGKIEKEVAVRLLTSMQKKSPVEQMDIAVIGLSVNMPDASNANQFWDVIAGKRDCIIPFPHQRKKDVDRYLDFMGVSPDERPFAKAGYLDRIDEFDARFFHISPKEAELMDPNQRLFLQTAMSAIEDAGYGGERVKGERVGVYVGYDNSTVNAYRQMIADVQPDLVSLATTGNILPIIASRISHILDLKGPAMLIDTTCSSSLLAVHLARKAIQNGDCEMAIAGSVKMNMLPLLPEDKLGVEASDGRTRTFDDRADGTGIGEGVGAVLLKPLKAALRDGDAIYAVMKGSAANHDGKSIGLTAPNVKAQQDVITRALKDAQFEADSIGYIEAHGTGTTLGDPIEIEGISRAFAAHTEKKQFCAISSLKSNIGHLDHGAGIASFIKTVLALHKKMLPPTLHFERPNRNIPFLRSPLYVNDRLKPWNQEKGPRRAGVSSFGLSGTNCHILLEEAPERTQIAAVQGPFLLTLSAHTATALKKMLRQYRSFLQTATDVSIGDLCYTANTGRGRYEHRLALLVTNKEDLERKLQTLLEDGLAHQPEDEIYYEAAATGRDGQPMQLQASPYAGTVSVTERMRFLQQLAARYVNGDLVNWHQVYPVDKFRKVHLPTYPFEKDRYWISVPASTGQQEMTPMTRKRMEVQFTHVELVGDIEADELDPSLLQSIANTWGHFLGLSSLHIEDQLFELGGDSIFATKIISALNEQLPVELDIADLLTFPELGRFAQLVQEKQSAAIVNGEVKKESPFAAIERVGPHIPLTSAQHRLYLFSTVDPKALVYNMPSAFIVKGPLQLDRLEKAFQRLLQKHEILRTSFHLQNGEAYQKVHEDVPFQLQKIEAGEQELPSIMKSFIRPFSLEEAPLLRAAVATLPSHEHLLLFDVHHIVCDGASTEILLRDLLKAYYGQEDSNKTVQFTTFAQWQQTEQATAHYQQQLAYWKEQLAGELPALTLPTDRRRPAIQQFDGQKYSFELNRQQLASIKALALQTDSTLFMVLLAAYNVFLSKYARQEDIIIGSPIAGRRFAELDGTIGMFVNTLPLRNEPKKELSFLDFLQSVKRNTLEAMKNQEVAFEDVIDALQIPRDLSRNPIFDAMFMMQNVGVKDIQMEELHFTPVPSDNRSSRVDFTMNVMEKQEQLHIDFEYATALFDESTIERMARNFMTLLQSICEAPAETISELKWLSAEEEQSIRSVNETLVPFAEELTIHQLFEQQVDATPDHIAVTFQGEQLTYRELYTKANDVAYALVQAGVQPNDIVAICMPRSPHLFVSMYGILMAGAAYLPIDPEYPENRIRHMLSDSGATVMIHADSLPLTVDEQVKTIRIDHVEAAATLAQSGRYPVQADQSAYVIYTSGSTGLPKGVVISHRNVHNFIVGVTEQIPFTEAKVLLSVTTMSFDIFVLESLLALAKGVKVVLASEDEQMNPRLLGQCMQSERAQMLQITPSRLKLLLESKEGVKGLHHLSEILVGGEAFPEHLLEKLKAFPQLRIFNMYGPTETTVWSTIKELTTATEITVGTPMANTSVYVVDENLQLQPIGVPGELLIGGAGVAKGYLHRPELTDEKFINHPTLGAGKIYRTGDVARLLANGELDFLGRNDNLVKVRGYRIELPEIEKQLLQHPSIVDAAVITKEDHDGDTQLLAFYTEKEAVDSLALKQFLQQELPFYMVPDLFFVLEAMPQTPNGKINRHALLEAEPKKRQHQIEVLSSGGETTYEQQLLPIWRDVLGVQSVSTNDNFFVLGGNSMKAIKMIAKAEEQGISLVINDVFSYQTIEALATYLQMSGKGANKLRNVEEIENHIAETIQQQMTIQTMTVDEKSIILYGLEQLDPHTVETVLALAEQDVHPERQPNYVVAQEVLATLQHDEVISEQQLVDILALRPVSQEEENTMVEKLLQAHAAYEETILAEAVTKEYRLAPIEFYFLGPERYSGTLLAFSQRIDLEVFQRAIVQLVKTQGVFRNVLVERETGLFWQEYDVPESIEVPFIDLSMYDPASRLQMMERVVSDYFFKPYEEYGKLYYRMALIKEDEKNYYLFLPVNHSIFDAMSGEIVKRQLLEFYERMNNDEPVAIDNPLTYLDFVEQVRKGPVGMTDAEIVEAFHLDAYTDSTEALNEKLKAFHRGNSTYFKFEIRTKNEALQFDRDNAWAIAFELLAKFIQNYIHNDTLPVSVFYYGRNYENRKFFDTVGEFIDLIPVQVGLDHHSTEQIADFIQSRMLLAEEHNLNFSNFAIDSKLVQRYPQVTKFVKEIQETSSIIFNFQGKLEDQEMDAFEQLLYKRLMYQLNREEAVNIYFATRYSNDVIQIDLSLPFDEDADRLLRFFQSECAFISNVEVAKYE